MKKRKPGRPSLKEAEKLGGGHTAITIRKDLYARVNEAKKKYNATLDFTINRQQFMEVMLTHWENTRGDTGA